MTYKQKVEDTAWILLTNFNFFILVQNHTSEETLRGFSIYGEHKLTHLKKLSVGLFYQFFKVEVEEEGYVFITREHQRTHKFVDLLHKTIKECEDNFFPLQVQFLTTETRKNLASVVNRLKYSLQSYTLVYQQYTDSAFKPLLSGNWSIK